MEVNGSPPFNHDVRKCGEALEVHRPDWQVAALEAGTWKTAMGHARGFSINGGIGGWTSEQTKERQVDSAPLVL